jgi:anhydro-N-acetylmuramic acid kinase
MEIEFTTYKTIGLMSGTSLDGLDVAYCEFNFHNKQWHFEIPFATTYPFPKALSQKLRNAATLKGEDLHKLSVEFGKHSAGCVNQFMAEHPCSPQIIASHGHTIFHRPDLGYTLQIGNGADIAAGTGITTICDFRSADVALGGQGAPLVPIGDRLLFGQYDFCLNIGGFANISHEVQGQRKAWDVVPANIMLNALSLQCGKPFDEDGRMASEGNLIAPLLEALNSFPYYQQKPPKSLGREWLEQQFFPQMESFKDHSVGDLLRTVTEHIAFQIAQSLGSGGAEKTMLITGGGAFNGFLRERIAHYAPISIILPDPSIIHFKEAMIFAFLGVLRLRGEVNCLASVTGASRDHCSGSISATKSKV